MQACHDHMVLQTLMFLQDGFTPIMIAAKAGHKEVVELLKIKCNLEEPSEEVLVSESNGYCALLYL